MTVSNTLLIAVVDDDAAVRNSLKFSLEIDGYVVRTFATPAALLHSADAIACQCIITDQDMPGMTGLELVALLRKQDNEVPIILMSGHVTPALQRLASDAGVLVVEKPFPGNGLIETIRTAVAAQPN